jgi:hypothetical protein
MLSDKVYFVLVAISSLSVLLPLSICVWLRNLLPAPLKWLFVYLIITAFTELFSYLMWRQHMQNIICFDVFGALEGPILLMMYKNAVDVSRRWFAFLFMLVTLSGIAVLVEPHLNGIVSGMRYLVIGSFTLLYFQDVFRRLEIPFLPDHYFFWINSALLFYFGSTFLLTIFEDVAHYTRPQLGELLWPIQLVANTLRNFILPIGIWKIRTQLQYS